MEQNTIEEGKTMAIIAYITVIGTIIAYFMNKDKNNEFAAFHIKQGFRLFIFGVIISIVAFILVSTTSSTMLGYLNWVPYIFIILGIMNASSGKDQKLPLIG